MSVLLALAALACGQAGPIDRWGGFKEGSWVKAKVTSSIKGNSSEFETTRTITQIHAEQIVLTVQNSPGGKTALYRMRRDLLSTIGSTNAVIVEQKDVGTEDITVGSKSFACKVHALKWKQSKDAKADDTLKLWESDQVPGRLVKVEGTLHDAKVQGAEQWIYSGKITSLDEKQTVAGQERPCALFESTATGPGTWTDKVWISKDVPGLILRSLGEREIDGLTEKTEWIVVGCGVKK